MPKQKTKSSALKRFKVTKRGKLLYRGQNQRHLKKAKSKAQLRRAKEPKSVYKAFAKKIRTFMSS